MRPCSLLVPCLSCCRCRSPTNVVAFVVPLLSLSLPNTTVQHRVPTLDFLGGLSKRSNSGSNFPHVFAKWLTILTTLDAAHLLHVYTTLVVVAMDVLMPFPISRSESKSSRQNNHIFQSWGSSERKGKGQGLHQALLSSRLCDRPSCCCEHHVGGFDNGNTGQVPRFVLVYQNRFWSVVGATLSMQAEPGVPSLWTWELHHMPSRSLWSTPEPKATRRFAMHWHLFFSRPLWAMPVPIPTRPLVLHQHLLSRPLRSTQVPRTVLWPVWTPLEPLNSQQKNEKQENAHTPHITYHTVPNLFRSIPTHRHSGVPGRLLLVMTIVGSWLGSLHALVNCCFWWW